MGVIFADPDLITLLSRGSGAVVLAVFVVLILTGRLVPKGVVDRAIADRDRVIQERNNALELVFKQAQVAQRALEAAQVRGEVR